MSPSAWVELQRVHFEKRASSYSRLYGRETSFHRAMVGELIRFSGAGPGLEALDLGCGYGRLTVPLLRAGCRVTGLDISPQAVRSLRRHVEAQGLGERFTPLEGAAEEISFERKFHLVLGRGLLHHLEDPRPVVDRCLRALVPGGRIVFQDPNPLQPIWALLILLHPTLSWKMERRLWRGTPRWSKSLLGAAGFQGVRHEICGLAPPFLWAHPRLNARIEAFLRTIPGIRELGLYVMVSGTVEPASM